MSNLPPYMMIATPCYGNMLVRGYLHSVMQLKELLQMNGIRVDVNTIGNESLITRARNYFISIFLAEEKYTHIMFIDADITFNPASILRMVQSDKDVVGGCYPHKSINWDQIKKLGDVENLEAKSHTYVVNILQLEGNKIQVTNGFIPVSYVGTGFMMIKRGVVEKMVEKFPETKYINDVRGYDRGNNSETFYALFDCFIDPISKRYLSEDFAFCQRWLNMSGEIWADITCDLVHTGSYEFKGSFGKIFNFPPTTTTAASAAPSPPPEEGKSSSKKKQLKKPPKLGETKVA